MLSGGLIPEETLMNDDDERLKQRGRMAYLRDDIDRLSRERDTLLQPLRDRCGRALPRDEPRPEAARPFDTTAATQELASVTAVAERLEAAIAEHDELARRLGLSPVRRS